MNKLRGTLQVVRVQAPGFGDRRKAMLEDIAILTGGKLISEDLGIKLENVKWEDLGTARKVTVDKDDTTIVLDDQGAKKKEAIAGLILTTEAVVCAIPEEDKKTPPMPGGGGIWDIYLENRGPRSGSPDPNRYLPWPE